ncbi:uncharacterized protein LOC115938083 isoform X2 [Leptonychotes weddellii]|uniref:Uncharacterized protein LOC115938083 isoform X2 n=1 Tax=Leptonychotes weddellii TaxID=9713 RepID=A0A7F8Q7B2_LEPWE|nr:uncharacterized protein LOC115938083 isoform X2 [Leptonychotes weddellii]
MCHQACPADSLVTLRLSEHDSSQSTPKEAGPIVAFGRHSRTAEPRTHAFFLPPRSAGDPCNSASLRSRSFCPWWAFLTARSLDGRGALSPVPLGTTRTRLSLGLFARCTCCPWAHLASRALWGQQSWRQPLLSAQPGTSLECSPNAPRPPVIHPRCRKAESRMF